MTSPFTRHEKSKIMGAYRQLDTAQRLMTDAMYDLRSITEKAARRHGVWDAEGDDLTPHAHDDLHQLNNAAWHVSVDDSEVDEAIFLLYWYVLRLGDQRRKGWTKQAGEDA